MKASWQHFNDINKIIKEFSSKSKAYQLSCLLLAISRLLQVISFFLPLKILIMLSSSQPPSYLKHLPFAIPYDALLVIFASMVPIAYGGYIIAGILHRFLLDKDLEKWKKENFTTKLIKSNSKNKVIKLHNHVAKALSEVILVTISLALICFVDFPMAIFALLLTLANLSLFVKKVFYKSEHDRIGLFQLHRRQYIEYISSANFVLVFIVLALQIKHFDIGVFEALFVLLLSRMIFQAVQRFSIGNLFMTSSFSTTLH